METTRGRRSIAVRIGDLLGVPEIEKDERLRMILAALNLYFYVTFTDWYGNPALSTLGTETFNFVPTWVFESLRGIIFLNQFWTKNYFCLLLFLALAGFFLALRRQCLWAALILGFLFLNKTYYYLSELRLITNYHHIHLILTLAFLISKPKLFFFRLALMCCYLLAAMTKMTPSWLYGEAFNSVPDKLPLLPRSEAAVTWACRGVILLETLGPLLWFSRRRTLRMGSVLAFIAFHLYSAVLVGYRYPTIMLPTLIPAFLNFDKPVHTGYRFVLRHLVPWSLLGFLLAGGLTPFLIPGDVRLTGEGRYLGLFMFDANRAATFHAEARRGDQRLLFYVERPWRSAALDDPEEYERIRRGKVRVKLYEKGILIRRLDPAQSVRDRGLAVWNPQLFTRPSSISFGDPYLYYFFGKEFCRRYKPDRLSLLLHQQLDGHEERHLLLDLPDFCATNPIYHPFRHNEWISISPPARRTFFRPQLETLVE